MSRLVTPLAMLPVTRAASEPIPWGKVAVLWVSLTLLFLAVGLLMRRVRKGHDDAA